MRLLYLIGLVLVFSAPPAIADDVEDGLAAYARKDFSVAFEKFRKAAGQGNAKAQYGLGAMYRRGEGVPLDAKQAMYWLEQSAAGGFSAATEVIGEMLATGEGVQKDVQKAISFYEKAATQGNGSVQWSVAIAYQSGEKIPRNFKRAAYWFEKSAEQGSSLAQSALAGMYLQGEGVVKDYIEAYKWYSLAASSGDTTSSFQLSLLERMMTRQQIAEAQRRAAAFVITKSEPTAPALQTITSADRGAALEREYAAMSGRTIAGILGILGQLLLLFAVAAIVPIYLHWYARRRRITVGPKDIALKSYGFWIFIVAAATTRQFFRDPTLGATGFAVMTLSGIALAGIFSLILYWLYGRFFQFGAQLAVANEAADEPIYETVMKEFDGNEKRSGVWGKALAESDGDEAKAKARYIQHRVQQIKAEAKR